MKSTKTFVSMRMGRLIAMAAVAVAAFPVAHADEVPYWSDTPVTCHWIGKVRSGYTSSSDYTGGFLPMPQMGYAQWTNQNNWAEGIVPGRLLVMHEDGSGTTNGCVGCTAVFDENCDISCIALYGMVSISNILVTGATAPRFYFGHWRWDNPHLFIEQGGSFRVTADVPEAPYVIPQIRYRDVTHTGRSLTLENNSQGVFDIGYIGHVEPALPAWLGTLDLRIEGTGEVQKRSATYSSSWQPTLTLAQTGGKYVAVSPDTNITGADRAVQVEAVDTGYTQQIEIPLGKMFKIEDNPGIIAMGDMTISGEGTLYLGNTGATPTFRVADGKTVEISAVIVRNPSAAASHAGMSLGLSGYTGTMRLTGTNTFPGAFSVGNGSTLEVPAIGLGDVGSPVGKKGVTLGGKSFLRYTGNGETTDRKLYGEGFGTVILAGTGDLVWKGEISGGTTYYYTISNESATARFVCATSTVAKSLQIVQGTRLGFAKPDDSDAIAMDKLVMAGDASVEVDDGVTVTLAVFERTKGKLAVTLTGSGKLIFPGVSAGPAPDWLTVNGQAAWYAADGSVYATSSLANSRTIAAHGDTVPDAPGEAVGITMAGDPAQGDDTLAATTTRVRVLNQETTEPATVALTAEQTLQANLIRVKSGAGNLTVGTTPGVGAVTATESAFEVIAEDAAATLTVNAAVTVPAAVPIHASGAGTNVLADMNGYAGKLSLVEGTAVISNSPGVSTATLHGTGTFDFANDTMTLTESDADGIAATYASATPINAAVKGGKLKLSGDQTLPMTAFRVYKGELVLNGPTLAATGVSIDMAGATQPDVSFVVGSNATGVVHFEGGSITGRLEIAPYNSSVSRGAVYQTGGEFVNVTKNGETTVMGSHGYAYYGLYDGRYVAAGDWYLANDGEGILDISGGELWHTPDSIHKSRARLGDWGAQAAVRISGSGVFNATNSTEDVIIPGYARQNTSSDLTVENGGRFLHNSSKTINLGRGYGSDKPYHAIVNINAGGTVQAQAIVRSSGSVYPSAEWPEGTSTDTKFTNMYSCVNCNGGTLVNMGYTYLFGNRTVSWLYPPNRVTLFEGGLTIATNGKDCSLAAGGGLQAPSGQGVVSIPWNAATDGKGYIGSPLVRIEGDGRGATAWADFDYETGTVTGIHVTGPGNDYTYANAKVIMNKVALKTIPCVLGVQTSGGLTKAGSGTLTLNATNTYTGATVVKKGTLKLGYDNVIAAASELVLDGGTLDMNNKAQTFANVQATTNGGTVVNGTLTLSGLLLDFDDILAGKVQNIGAAIAFAPGAQLVVANVDKAARPPNRYVLATFSEDINSANLAVSAETLANLPPRWKIDVERRRIMLRYPMGATLNFR